MSSRSHEIIKTYIDRAGRVQVGKTGVVGGTDKEALYLFEGNVRAASTTLPQVIGLVLVDAAGTMLAEWARPVVMQVAS